MIRERRGVAGIFDALVFLTIASVVSVALLSTMAVPSLPPADPVGPRVDSSHSVLLRTTVEDASGNACTLEELFKLEAVDVPRYKDIVTMILDLLLPTMEWQWTVQGIDHHWVFGEGAGPSGDLFCSIVRAPFDGGEVEYRLEAWYTYS